MRGERPSSALHEEILAPGAGRPGPGARQV